MTGVILVSLTFLLVFAVLIVTTIIIAVIVVLRKQKKRRDSQSETEISNSSNVNETVNDIPIYESLEDEHTPAAFPMSEIINGLQNTEGDVIEPYVFTTCSAYEL